MFLRTTLVLTMLFAFSCASTSENGAKFVETPSPRCSPVAKLTAMGFNIIPPVATMLAKSMLQEKAIEFGADEILIDKEEGLFNVRIEATGFACP